MDKLKQWVVLTALAAVLLLAAGWVLLISPSRDEAVELREQVSAQVSANAVLQAELQVLEQQARELPDKAAELARVTAKIPDDPSMPLLIRAVTAASKAAGVQLVSLTPGPPVAAPAAVPGAPAAAAPAPAPAGSPAATDPVAPAVGAVGGLATVPVTLQVVGGYFETAKLLTLLEDLPRALKVQDLTLSPGSGPAGAQAAGASLAEGRSLASTITGSVFLVAAAPAAPPVAAAAPTT